MEDEIKRLVIEKTYIERRIKSNEEKIRDVELSGGKVEEDKIASLE